MQATLTPANEEMWAHGKSELTFTPALLLLKEALPPAWWHGPWAARGWGFGTTAGVRASSDESWFIRDTVGTKYEGRSEEELASIIYIRHSNKLPRMGRFCELYTFDYGYN